ncbi:unnamed protein product, partial [Didymodactylos carnosus]
QEFLYTPPDLTEPKSKSKLTTNNDHDEQRVLLATVYTQPDPRLQSQSTTLLLPAAPRPTVIPRQQPDTLLISQPPNAAETTTDGTMLQDAPTDEDDFIDSSVLPLTALNGKESYNVSMTDLSKDDETSCMSVESKDGETESNVNDHTIQGSSTVLPNVATHASQDGISSRTRHKQCVEKLKVIFNHAENVPSLTSKEQNTWQIEPNSTTRRTDGISRHTFLGTTRQESDNGNKYVLVITDYLTKFVIVKALPNNTVQTTAQTFVEELIFNFGVPDRLIADQGVHFNNELMKNVAELIGFDYIKSIPYHLQTNGQVERFNATFRPQLAKLQGENLNH